MYASSGPGTGKIAHNATATKFSVAPAEHQDVKPFLRRTSTHRKVESLIRRGVGVSESAWEMTPGGDSNAALGLAEEIAEWVRQSMGGMRRPYGIDHVAVALACRDSAGSVLCTSSLGVIRPISFYGEEGAAQIAGFLEDVENVRGDGVVSISGALLSLGDLAFELDSARAA